MRKAVTGSLAFLLIAALFAGALLVAGCGSTTAEKSSTGQTASGEQSAKALLAATSKKMQSVKTARATGGYKMDTTAGGTQNMQFKYQMEMNVTNSNDPQMHMVTEGSTQTEMYVTGGYAYVNVPGTGWVKSPSGSSESMSGTTPAEITKFANNAENLRIISQDAVSYKIGFTVSRKYMEQALKQQQGDTSLGPDVEKLIQQTITGMKMSAIFTVNKRSLYTTAVALVVEMKNMPAQTSAAVGDIALNMTLGFSDFNQPVTITLPPEAANATLMPESSTSTGIPSLPGLGF